MNTPKVRSAATLCAIMIVATGIAESSCSTIAEPSEGDEPPECKYCDPGTQELRCEIGAYWTINSMFYGYVSDSAYVCLEPDATEQEKEDACIDSCEAYIANDTEDLYCDFLANAEEPFYWTGCTPPDDTGGSQSHNCPSWYSPTTRVSDYQATSGSATVTIDRVFVSSIRSDMFSLYVCDTTRYVQSTSDWTFDDVASGDLFYELGVRDGDQNATVQGFDPQTSQTTTSAYLLDSITDMRRAYDALRTTDGVKLTVERSGAPGGEFVIWITIE
jgi:hypothetical protein